MFLYFQCGIHYIICIILQTTQTHSKFLSSISDGRGSYRSSSSNQRGSQKAGGKKQGKVKGREKQYDFDDNDYTRELQFMSTVEV